MNPLDTLDTFSPAELDDIAESGDTVTVTRRDGKTATGRLAPHATEPGVYKIVTGVRGRPLTFAADDVTAVTSES